jgi:hypothetical protein
VNLRLDSELQFLNPELLLLLLLLGSESDPPLLDEATAERVMAALYRPDSLQATLLTAWRCNRQVRRKHTHIISFHLMSLASPFYSSQVLKVIVLPRQAQDNHRKTRKTKGAFSYSTRIRSLSSGALGRRKHLFLAPFNLNVKNDLFAKTGSGRKEMLKKRRFLQAAAGSAARA